MCVASDRAMHCVLFAVTCMQWDGSAADDKVVACSVAREVQSVVGTFAGWAVCAAFCVFMSAQGAVERVRAQPPGPATRPQKLVMLHQVQTTGATEGA